MTGASSGIGRALCELLAKEGIHLLITGRNKLNLYKIADELRRYVNIVVYPADLTNHEERAKIVEKIQQLAPDLVINNAGYGLYGLGTDLGSKAQLDMIELNVSALVEITTEAGKAMMEAHHPGVIMNISSVAAFMPFPGFAVYGASKAFVNSYSVAMDAELSDKGIRVLASCPGQVQTNFSHRASQGRYTSSSENKMSSEYAAKQVWVQILKKKVLNPFDWKYKVSVFFLNYLLPTKLVAKLMMRRILKRTESNS